MIPPPTYKLPTPATGNCPRHGKYTGKGIPKSDCSACWRLFLETRGLVNARPLAEAAIVRLTNYEAANHFAEDIKKAVDKARHSGGGYSAFLHDAGGSIIVQVNVCFPRED